MEWNGRHLAVAATWDELPPAQLRALLPVLLGQYADPVRQRLDALAGLLGVPPVALLRLSDVQLAQLLELTDFLLREPVGLTRQPLPALRPAWYGPRYCGPGDGLAGVSFLEFAFADAYFVAAAQAPEGPWLDLLLGTLYRPQRRPYRPRAADYGGDRRAEFNEHHVEAHAARLGRLPLLTRQLVLLYYRGCRHALERRYPHVFTPAQEAQAEAHPDGWAHVLRELSGQAFGNFQQTGRQDVETVLAKLNDDVARAEQLRREQELAAQRGH